MVRRHDGRLFQTSGPETANTRRTSSVGVRREGVFCPIWQDRLRYVTVSSGYYEYEEAGLTGIPLLYSICRIVQQIVAL